MDAEQNSRGMEHTLTPSELVNSVLKTNIFGGYSKTQVDILLERAADVLEALLQENAELKRKTEQLEQTVEKYGDIEASLRGALVSSQKMGENMVASAKLQADALLEEARLARARAVFKMEKLPDALRAEIQRLMDARERLRDDLAALLESHGALIARIPGAEAAVGEFVGKELERTGLYDDDDEEDEEDEDVEEDESDEEEEPVFPPPSRPGAPGTAYGTDTERGYVNL